jgi:Tfp pilus assembly protein PilP
MTPPPPILILLLCAALLCACGDDPPAAPAKSAPSSVAKSPAANRRGGKGSKKKTVEELKAEISRKSPLTASIFSPITEKTRPSFAENRNPFFGFVDIRITELERQRQLDAAAKATSGDTATPIKLEPLQLFDLRQLKLVATITNTAIVQADILDPSGEHHIVQIGTPIGPLGGQIVNINESELKIIRTQKQKDGTALSTCTIMRLSLSLDSLILATREAEGLIEPIADPPSAPPCEVIRFYPKSLDNIKISYQD